MKRSLAILALPAFLFAAPAFAQSMCVVAGNQPIMGANMTADFDVAAGKSCMYDIKPRGTLTSAAVTQPPQNGTIKMVRQGHASVTNRRQAFTEPTASRSPRREKASTKARHVRAQLQSKRQVATSARRSSGFVRIRNSASGSSNRDHARRVTMRSVTKRTEMGAVRRYRSRSASVAHLFRRWPLHPPNHKSQTSSSSWRTISVTGTSVRTTAA